MENKSMPVKKTDSILAYYEKPHSKRILKNFYKNFYLTYKFCKTYFMLSLSKYAPLRRRNKQKNKGNGSDRVCK